MCVVYVEFFSCRGVDISSTSVNRPRNNRRVRFRLVSFFAPSSPGPLLEHLFEVAVQASGFEIVYSDDLCFVEVFGRRLNTRQWWT